MFVWQRLADFHENANLPVSVYSLREDENVFCSANVSERGVFVGKGGRGRFLLSKREARVVEMHMFHF